MINSCLIVDDDPLIRAGLRGEIGSRPEFHEIAGLDQAAELLAAIGSIDVAIVKFSPERALDGVNARGSIKELLRVQPSLGVVARGAHADRQTARLAREAGAHGFIDRKATGEVIMPALEAAVGQRSYTDPAVEHNGSMPRITRRQREVLQLLSDGLGTPDIALRLGVSEETVRAHAKAAIGRLNARDRTHAVAMAMRRGLIV